MTNKTKPTTKKPKIKKVLSDAQKAKKRNERKKAEKAFKTQMDKTNKLYAKLISYFSEDDAAEE